MTHALEFEPLAWQDDANCATTDPDIFFPDHGEPAKPGQRICASCDVREQCLEYALTTHQTAGTWGGLSARERAKLLTPRNPNERIQQIIHLHNLHTPTTEIAAQLGCTERTIQRLLKEHREAA